MNYYDQHAREYFESTFQVDMASVHAPLLARLHEGDLVLDAGCGSGRDALAFSRLGYRVMAFDACAPLVERARRHTGLDVRQCSFLGFQAEEESIHGIWACASLLHLPFAVLPGVFTHLARFLVLGGAFYCSFKYGAEEVEREGRHFTDLDEARLEKTMAGVDLDIAQVWQSSDLRPERAGESWLNAILVK